MTLSIVIICWNSLENLRQLLESITISLKGVVHEIIVIDNGSEDGTDIFIADRYKNITYRRLDRNHGVAYARNRGIEIAKGKYIWILDDDTLVNPEAANTLLNHMESHPKCGIAACALKDSDGNLQQSYKPYPGLDIKLRNILGINTPDCYKETLNKGVPFEPVYVIGACQLIRREVFDSTGMLDEHIFYGPEDADFCLRARNAGWSITYIPSISIIHKWKRITTQRPLSRIGQRHICALFYLYFKHKRFLS